MNRIHGFAERVPVRGPVTLVVLVVLFATPTAALAQAWVPPAGVGAVSFVYQTIANTGHRMTDRSNLEGYDSSSRGMLLDVDYAITNRFSLAVGLPYIAREFLGPLPSFAGEVDECRCWHHGWQDFGATARYNLVNGPFALTPSVSFGVPSHDYAYFGEAVVGRNLKEMRLVIDAGRRLDAISPRLSVQGRYSYAFVEKVLDLPNNRSNASLEAGVLITIARVTRGVLVAALAWRTDIGRGRYTGGIRAIRSGVARQPLSYRRRRGLLVPRMDLFMCYVQYVSGVDTHAGQVITAGFSCPLERPVRQPGGPPVPSIAPPARA